MSTLEISKNKDGSEVHKWAVSTAENAPFNHNIAEFLLPFGKKSTNFVAQLWNDVTQMGSLDPINTGATFHYTHKPYAIEDYCGHYTWQYSGSYN